LTSWIEAEGDFSGGTAHTGFLAFETSQNNEVKN